MTTYTDREESSHDASPIEGYKFVGTSQTFRYTSALEETTIDGEVYTPVSIKRNAIKQGTHKDDQFDLELEVPYDLELVSQYAFITSPPDLYVEIRRFHVGTNPSTDFILSWKGKVTGFSVTGRIAKIRVPSIFSIALQGQIPSVWYHIPCNHRLYDDRCKVVRANFSQNTTIAVGGVSSGAITVVNDGFADNFLNAGVITLSSKGEKRLIVSNIANVITINYPFHDAEEGDLVELAAGCNHAFLGDCDTKFGNTDNYGGFPYIPGENPFEGAL